MRGEASDWLEPMLVEAEKRDGINIEALMWQASMPAAEADAPWIEQEARRSIPPEGKASAVDWVRFGELLRQALGWDDKYPAYPDFPETRDVP